VQSDYAIRVKEERNWKAKREHVSLINKLFKMGIVCWFALSQIIVGMSSANAQSGSIDVEPPLIEHEVVSALEADIRQTFFATVVDDNELDSVSLYYRFQKDPTYSTVLMKRVSFSSTYIVHVPTDPDSDRDIEYYIQARDKAGNRTVRGFAFNPLLREINFSTAPPAAAPAPVKADTTAPAIGKKRTVLYVVLGALAVGLIAGLANSSGGSGGSGGSTPSEPCPDGLCTVTVTIGQP